MRRFAFVLALALSGLLVVAPSASALCTTQPFDRAIHQADAVWWGTVTDATLRGRGSGNNWTLTVRISDVLKGHEQSGDTSQYLGYSCGPFLTREAGKKIVDQFIGQQRLFVGRYVAGGLNQTSDFLTPPQGLSPAEQYQRALKDLGLQRTPSPSPRATKKVPPPFVFPVWVVIVAAALVVLVAVGIFVVARRRRTATG